MSDLDVRIKSLEDLLAACKIEYDDRLMNWNSLDGKAQGAIGVAGLFIGGLLSLLPAPPATAPLFSRILVALALGCLIAAVLFSLRVLVVRDVVDPPGSSTQALLAGDLQRLGDQEAVLPGRYQAYLGDRAALWRHSIADLQTRSEAKARGVQHAQFLVVTAVILVGILTLANVV